MLEPSYVGLWMNTVWNAPLKSIQKETTSGSSLSLTRLKKNKVTRLKSVTLLEFDDLKMLIKKRAWILISPNLHIITQSRKRGKHHKSIPKSGFPSCIVAGMLGFSVCLASRLPPADVSNDLQEEPETVRPLASDGSCDHRGSSWWIMCVCHLAVVQGCAFWGFSSGNCCPFFVFMVFFLRDKEDYSYTICWNAWSILNWKNNC